MTLPRASWSRSFGRVDCRAGCRRTSTAGSSCRPCPIPASCRPEPGARGPSAPRARCRHRGTPRPWRRCSTTRPGPPTPPSRRGCPTASDRTRSGSGPRPDASSCAVRGTRMRLPAERTTCQSSDPGTRPMRVCSGSDGGQGDRLVLGTDGDREVAVEEVLGQQWDAVGVERPVGIEPCGCPIGRAPRRGSARRPRARGRRHRTRRRSSPPGCRSHPSGSARSDHASSVTDATRELAVDLEVEAGRAATPRPDLTGADDDDHVVEVDRRGSGRDDAGSASAQHQRRRQGRGSIERPRPVVRRRPTASAVRPAGTTGRSAPAR